MVKQLLNRRLSAGLGSVVALVLVLSPGVATAEGTGTADGRRFAPPPHTAMTSRALELRTAVHDIRGFVRATEQGGFVQAAIDPKGNRATVFWHGEPPQDARRKAAASAHDIEFVQVPFSLDTLRGEAKRISAEYPYVVSAGPSADYRGLDVRVDRTKMTDRAISSPLPVNVIPTRGGFVPLARHADTSPYWGGTWIVNRDDGSSCSTGFAVIVHPAGNEGLTTAAHCEVSGASHAWGEPFGDEIYGYQSRVAYTTDAMLLVGAGKVYDAAVYNGGWQSNSGWAVEDWFDPLVGEWACDSGGLSGEVCDNVVVMTDTYIDGAGPGYITESYHNHNYGSAGEGDSGGASYLYGSYGVIAAGSISAGLLESEMACPPDAVPLADRECYSVIFHVNIEAMAQALTMTPQTQ